MRIVCSVSDYYDGVQQSVGETDVKWYRNPQAIPLNEVYDHTSRRYKRTLPAEYAKLEPLLEEAIVKKALRMQPFELDYVSKAENVTSVNFHRTLLFFCGKFYGGLGTHTVLKSPNQHKSTALGNIITRSVLWTEEQILHYCNLYSIEYRPDGNGPFWRERYESWDSDKRIQKDRSKPFQPLIDQLGKKESPKFLDLALSLDLPILAFGHSTKDTPRIGTGDYHVMVKDAILSDYDFFRLFSAPQAYQELMMFKGSVANPAPPMVELTDKDKQTKFGFTHQYSFRKEPGGKNRRKPK